MPAKPMPAETARQAAAGSTREVILDAALRLFRERGYAKTTMRAVAEAAGVSVGNAYYYFDSKEHLIQGYYAQLHEEHLAAALPALSGQTDLGDRLRTALRSWAEVAAPYHDFARHFFVNAADPDSPMSPFSAQSAPTRRANTELFAEVIDGSKTTVDARTRAVLPELLWLVEMGVVLFWVYDKSAGTRRTFALIDRVAPLLARLVRLSRYPVARPLVRELAELAHDFALDRGPRESIEDSP